MAAGACTKPCRHASGALGQVGPHGARRRRRVASVTPPWGSQQRAETGRRNHGRPCAAAWGPSPGHARHPPVGPHWQASRRQEAGTLAARVAGVESLWIRVGRARGPEPREWAEASESGTQR